MNEPLTASAVHQLLNAYLKPAPDAAWYRAPDIPAKKLKNAIGKYAAGVNETSALALGDGTVFGSAKDGIIITGDALYSRTSEGAFSLKLCEVTGAEKLGGWPGYEIEITCSGGRSFKVSMSCFEKQQETLVAFLNAVARAGAGVSTFEVDFVPPPLPSTPVVRKRTTFGTTTVQHVNAGLRLIGICPRSGLEDAAELFTAASSAAEEWPLIKGACQYVGYNGREVDGIFLLTNRRLLLFSTESGAKIVFVETTLRLLDKVPFPFFDSIVGFFLFSIPRAIYVALRGGKEKMVEHSLAIDSQALLDAKPPLRKVQSSDFDTLSNNVSQIELGTGIWTGILARKFGVSFAPAQLTKAFSIPKDLILPEYETLEPFERLLHAAAPALSRLGLTHRLDAEGERIVVNLTPAARKAAA